MAFIETIVVVVSITRPIPQFALDGNLFYLQSIEADKYSKRQFIPLNFTDFEDPSSIEPKLYGKNSREENNEEARHMILEDRSLHARQDTSDTKPKQVSTDKFVAFWFGVFGACLQRA